MPGVLKEASKVRIPETIIDAFKVANHEVEDNVERWLNMWVIYGNIVDGVFVEYHDPATGQPIPPTQVKLEDGHHPLVPDSALTKCPSCGKWFQLETNCDEADCDGAELLPYDGFSRAGTWGISDPTYYDDLPGKCPYFVTKKALYEFLRTELVPDPTTGEERPLIDAANWV